jgi:hypothetical protein
MKIELMNTDKGEFPKEGFYVVGRYNGGNWEDEIDQYGNNWCVVTFKRGLSKEDREKMEECERKYTYVSEDQACNNLVPWCWNNHGSTIFGQDINYWFCIPKFKEIL